MNEHYRRARRLGLAAFCALGMASAAAAEPAPQLNVYATGVAQSATRVLQLSYMKSVRKGWENGPNFVQTGGTDGRVVGLIKDGAPADIVIVQTSEMEGLVKAGLVRPETAKRLGRVDIGVAVKSGAPRPDISTYPKFRDALIAAGSVAYTDPKSGSAGGKLIQSILDKPEFAGVKPAFGARVSAGEAPIWLETVGQLSTAYGVDTIGVVPESLNAHLDFSIAVGAKAPSPEAAIAFENYLLQPQLSPVWAKWGIVR